MGDATNNRFYREKDHSMDDRTDSRFDEMRKFETREDERGQMMLVNPLPAERPIGAQLVAKTRSETTILSKLKAIAAAAGEGWYYRWPVKSRDDSGIESKKWVEGASIKLANDLARLYGNCDVDVRVVEDANSWVFYARFMDLETGFSMTRPFQQRKSQKSIRGDADRQRDIAFQIGASKAIRNVIVNSLQTFSDYALEEAKNSIVEKIGKNIEGSRKRLGELLADRSIELSRVERVIGRKLGEFLAPDIARVLAMVKAIEDGMATLDESFPHDTVANPLGAQPEPGPGAAEPPPQEARQEPAGEPAGKEAPKRGRSKKNQQEATPPEPEPKETTNPVCPECDTVVKKGEEIQFQGNFWHADCLRLKQEAEKAEEARQARRAKLEQQAEQEQEAREAASSRPTKTAAGSAASPEASPAAAATPSTAQAAAPPKQPATAAPSVEQAPVDDGSASKNLRGDAFFQFAMDFIGKSQGSAGVLNNWWKGAREGRSSMTMEQQTAVSHAYNAKFVELMNKAENKSG